MIPLAACIKGTRVQVNRGARLKGTVVALDDDPAKVQVQFDVNTPPGRADGIAGQVRRPYRKFLDIIDEQEATAA